MRYRLRFRDRELDLSASELVIGRSTACTLCIDDPTVSRRHARIRLDADGASLEDMGSRNGLFLNGAPVRAPTPLTQGDRIRMGDVEMTVVCLHDRVGDTQEIMAPAVRMPPEDDGSLVESTQSATGPSWLLLEMADKALTMGRSDDAAWLVSKFAEDIDRRLRDGQRVPPDTMDRTTVQALRLAGATSDPEWLDWTFRVYEDSRRVLPVDAIDELHRLVRQLRYPATPVLQAYVDVLREMAPQMTPADRFLLQRIEGVLQVASLH